MARLDELLREVEEDAFARYCCAASASFGEDMTDVWVSDHDHALSYEMRACYHRAYQRACKWRDAMSHLPR